MCRIVAFGLVAATVLLPRSARADDTAEQAGSRFFFGLGIIPVAGRVSDGELSRTIGISMTAGQPLGRTLHIVESIVGIWGTLPDDEPVVVRNYGGVSAGVQWTPFAPRLEPSAFLHRYTDFTAVNVTLVVGLENRTTHTYVDGKRRASDAYAPSAGCAIGYFPARGEDYALGVEVRGDVSRYSDGYEYGFTIQGVARLMK